MKLLAQKVRLLCALPANQADHLSPSQGEQLCAAGSIRDLERMLAGGQNTIKDRETIF